MAYNNAAYVKIELGHAGDAVPLARKAQALAPDDAVTIDTLGLALLRSGLSKGEATTLLQRAAHLQPGDADIRAHLAEATGANP
jgi:Flp pilus assembly protein TadD